jgi:hypothetical protein
MLGWIQGPILGCLGAHHSPAARPLDVWFIEYCRRLQPKERRLLVADSRRSGNLTGVSALGQPADTCPKRVRSQETTRSPRPCNMSAHPPTGTRGVRPTCSCPGTPAGATEGACSRARLPGGATRLRFLFHGVQRGFARTSPRRGGQDRRRSVSCPGRPDRSTP